MNCKLLSIITAIGLTLGSVSQLTAGNVPSGMALGFVGTAAAMSHCNGPQTQRQDQIQLSPTSQEQKDEQELNKKQAYEEGYILPESLSGNLRESYRMDTQDWNTHFKDRCIQINDLTYWLSSPICNKDTYEITGACHNKDLYIRVDQPIYRIINISLNGYPDLTWSKGIKFPAPHRDKPKVHSTGVITCWPIENYGQKVQDLLNQTAQEAHDQFFSKELSKESSTRSDQSQQTTH